jgi:hypothetical protein
MGKRTCRIDLYKIFFYIGNKIFRIGKIVKKNFHKNRVTPDIQCLPEEVILIGSNLRITPGKDRGTQGKVVGGSGIQMSNGHGIRVKAVFFRYLVFLVRYPGQPNPFINISSVFSFQVLGYPIPFRVPVISSRIVGSSIVAGTV